VVAVFCQFLESQIIQQSFVHKQPMIAGFNKAQQLKGVVIFKVFTVLFRSGIVSEKHFIAHESFKSSKI